MIAYYLRNQLFKEAGSFKIGVFTVFLSVMVITFLESVLTCVPLIFVKFGQRTVGTIDYSMHAANTTTSMIQANTNYYNVDPFNNPVWPEVEPTPESTPTLPGADECNPCTTDCFSATDCEE